MSRGPGQAALRALLAGLLLALPREALALGLFEKNHPRVEQGLKAYQEGRFEEALAAFEDAKRELPDNAAVEFDRGNALYKLRRFKDAQEAYHRVAELDQGQLRQKDYYNLGNAFAELGQTKDAIAAYRKALLLDPNDDQARHNLEVVLRNLPPPKQPQPRPSDSKKGDGGSDAGRDGGNDGGGGQGPDSGTPPDAGRSDKNDPGGTGGKGTPGDGGNTGGLPDAGPDAGNTGGQPNQQQPTKTPPDGGSNASPADDSDEMQDEFGRDGGIAPAPMPELNKKDVERLLDSMKQSEKNLQLWRFQQRKKSSKSRKDNAKDW